MDTFDLIRLVKYLAEGKLFESEEDQFGAELDALARDQLAGEKLKMN